MFWKRKEEVSTAGLGPIVKPPKPVSSEFETMLEVLRDAEKFDSASEYELSKNTLRNLVLYIDDFTGVKSQLEAELIAKGSTIENQIILLDEYRNTIKFLETKIIRLENEKIGTFQSK